MLDHVRPAEYPWVIFQEILNLIAFICLLFFVHGLKCPSDLSTTNGFSMKKDHLDDQKGRLKADRAQPGLLGVLFLGKEQKMRKKIGWKIATTLDVLFPLVGWLIEGVETTPTYNR